MAGDKQQDNKDEAVSNPEDIQGEMEPHGQADLFLRQLWRHISAWFAFVSNLQASPDNKHHEKEIEEMLPSQPRRNPYWRILRKG